MDGLVFFKTKDLQATGAFYSERCGCSLWLDQGGCRIYRSGNLLLGFCRGQTADIGGTITFFFATRGEVDARYRLLADIALAAPRDNADFRIYHFFVRDPDGRMVEFQHFLHPLDWEFSPEVV